MHVCVRHTSRLCFVSFTCVLLPRLPSQLTRGSRPNQLMRIFTDKGHWEVGEHAGDVRSD